LIAPGFNSALFGGNYRQLQGQKIETRE